MFERIMSMFSTVAAEEHGSVLLVFIIGVLFGGIIQYTRADKFEKIAGFAMLKDTVVPKMLFLAIGLASIGLYFLIEAGYAHYHVKPVLLGGLIIGGVIFGVAMAIMGKCPGTGPISIAEGRIDVMVGAVGGILGGLVFTVYYDQFKMIMGPSFGNMTLVSIFEGHEALAVFIFGIGLVIISIIIPLREELDEADLEQINK